ncbi:hypothetical protein DSO57_1007813 [Entomophthora muscae]|uniref:Uncharacterized protein n=1 Tax=Entomophthora muscae TaxID=34485 RepID=A0ACC2S989_9FUNG|nr:hypothetical protein DSO57_1007813 [Entomophthora muscae]
MDSLYFGAVGLLVSVVCWWVYNVCYSLFFSPLRNIPGPLVLQLFPVYELLFRMAGTFNWKEREYLIAYGGVYRKGWRKVIFASEEAMNEIYSTQAYAKSDFYLALQTQGHNLFSTMDKDFHRERKRIMAPSFSQKEIESFDEDIRHEVVTVATSIIQSMAKDKVPIDMYRLFSSFTMDVIGLLGFGRNFHTLRNGPHPAEKWFQQSNQRIAFEIFFPLLRLIPNLPLSNLKRLGLQAAHDTKLSLDRRSIMASLINAKDPDTGSKLSDTDLADEAILQIFAGSDSTANSMTWALYFIVKHPNVYDKVVNELNEKFPSLNHEITMGDCKQGSLPYLDAAIKESMRVMPAASGALERLVPQGGRTIDGHFLPGGVILFCL